MNLQTEAKHLINYQIKKPKVLLLDEKGEKIGDYAFKDALKLANEQALDLMQVGTNNDIAICKVLKYDSWLYHQKKKQDKENFKNRGSDIKNIQLRPVTGEHDFQLKMKQASKFLDEGHKVKFTIKLKNYRETGMTDINNAIVNKVIEFLHETGEVDGKVSQGQKEINFFLKPAKKHNNTNTVVAKPKM